MHSLAHMINNCSERFCFNSFAFVLDILKFLYVSIICWIRRDSHKYELSSLYDKCEAYILPRLEQGNQMLMFLDEFIDVLKLNIHSLVFLSTANFKLRYERTEQVFYT